MGVRVRYDAIMDKIRRYVRRAPRPVMLSNGELQDSLALEPITHSARHDPLLRYT